TGKSGVVTLRCERLRIPRQCDKLGACRHQMSKARLTRIGSDVVGTRRNLAVDSIFAWPKSIRTISNSRVPLKPCGAFARRKDSLPYFLVSSPASAIQNFSRRFMCRTPIGRGDPVPRLGKT